MSDDERAGSKRKETTNASGDAPDKAAPAKKTRRKVTTRVISCRDGEEWHIKLLRVTADERVKFDCTGGKMVIDVIETSDGADLRLDYATMVGVKIGKMSGANVSLNF